MRSEYCMPFEGRALQTIFIYIRDARDTRDICPWINSLTTFIVSFKVHWRLNQLLDNDVVNSQMNCYPQYVSRQLRPLRLRRMLHPLAACYARRHLVPAQRTDYCDR